MGQAGKSFRVFSGGPLNGLREPVPTGKPPFYLDADKHAVQVRKGDALLRHVGIFTAQHSRRPGLSAAYYSEGWRYDSPNDFPSAKTITYRWVDVDDPATHIHH